VGVDAFGACGTVGVCDDGAVGVGVVFAGGVAGVEGVVGVVSVGGLGGVVGVVVEGGVGVVFAGGVTGVTGVTGVVGVAVGVQVEKVACGTKTCCPSGVTHNVPPVTNSRLRLPFGRFCGQKTFAA
jgi:hypothetical protein